MMFTLDQIKAIIPHREPFIFVDRVLNNESLVSTTAEKYVTFEEFWIPGHFPSEPVMPGVIIVEALAQTAAINILTAPLYAGHIGYFSSIQEVKFKRKVVPGDILKFVVTYLTGRAGFFFFEGEAYVGDQLACTAKFSVAVGQ